MVKPKEIIFLSMKTTKAYKEDFKLCFKSKRHVYYSHYFTSVLDEALKEMRHGVKRYKTEKQKSQITCSLWQKIKTYILIYEYILESSKRIQHVYQHG